MVGEVYGGNGVDYREMAKAKEAPQKRLSIGMKDVCAVKYHGPHEALPSVVSCGDVMIRL